MNLDDPRLTAYALNDPGLSDADRQWVTQLLANDAEAKAFVHDVQTLGSRLTAELQAEQLALPAKPITMPRRVRWKAVAGLVAGGLAICLAVGVVLNLRSESQRFSELTRMKESDSNSVNPASMVTNYDHFGKPADDSAVDFATAPHQSVSPVLSSPAPRNELRSSTMQPHAKLPSPIDKFYDSEKGDKDLNVARRLKESRGVDHTPELKPGIDAEWPESRQKQEGLGGRYATLVENPFVKVEGLNALSTFGVDVDTASYAIVRKYLTGGQMPPADAVRLEEMVNYFPYQDKAPDAGDPYAVRVELAGCPWAPKHQLARIAVKAQPVANDKRPPSNLVFLIDVSGSMDGPARLPLVKASLKLLVNQLGENDRVAMVVYAGSSGLVLDSTSGTNKHLILEALDRLHAGGSTNGAGGIAQAYVVATRNFLKNGTNRVILCTDGDWNVGTTSTDALISMIEEKRKTGVFLSVFGFGMGNLRDEMMVKLAGKGNGNYAYIDTIKEAHKALVEQLGGTLITVAKDVKIQIEFNPAVVQSYRLLGYEKRILAAQDFHDDTKDAGEMGAGHVVTAFYELVPAGVNAEPGTGDGLRYQAAAPVAPKAGNTAEAFLVKMRHKKPDADVSTLRELPVANKPKPYAEASEDFRFGASVAEFTMLLRQSPHRGTANYGAILELATGAMKHDPSGYRAEFVELVKMAQKLSAK
jgi:Ca-activated chloride channel homolog